MLYMNDYSVPNDESFQIGHFKSKKRIKKSLREFIAFDSNKKIFINMALLETNGFLCACADAIPVFQYDKKSPYFIDSQWIINEKIGGEYFWKNIERLCHELRNNETLWKNDEYKAASH